MASFARVFGKGRTLMAAAKTKVARVPSSTAGSDTASKKSPVVRGILKPQAVSPSLGKFVNASEAYRTEAVKKVWEYIKSHNLHNPENKKEIFCDEKLKSIFDNKDKVGFTDIAKLLSKHFTKTT